MPPTRAWTSTPRKSVPRDRTKSVSCRPEIVVSEFGRSWGQPSPRWRQKPAQLSTSATTRRRPSESSSRLTTPWARSASTVASGTSGPRWWGIGRTVASCDASNTTWRPPRRSGRLSPKSSPTSSSAIRNDTNAIFHLKTILVNQLRPTQQLLLTSAFFLLKRLSVFNWASVKSSVNQDQTQLWRSPWRLLLVVSGLPISTPFHFWSTLLLLTIFLERLVWNMKFNNLLPLAFNDLFEAAVFAKISNWSWSYRVMDLLTVWEFFQALVSDKVSLRANLRKP